MSWRLVGALAVVALLGVIGWRVVEAIRSRRGPEVASEEASLVRAARVAREDLEERLAFTGSVRPHNEVDVYPKLGGRIERLDVQVGDRVKAGQVLAVIEHKEIAWQAKAAEAAVEVARAAVAGARLEHDRVATLFKGGSATEAMLDGVEVKLALAQAQLAQAEAAAGLARQMLGNATIAAPISGTVVRRPVNLGAMVGQQSVMLTIQDTERLKLEAAVDAAAFARLKKGSVASISADAFPGERFAGAVSLMSPSLDPVSRRASLEIEIDNASGRLLPNLFARAEVTVGRLERTLTIPKAAIVQAAGGIRVYRLRDGRAEAVQPRLGPSDGERVAVLEGLAEGDLVAISGVAALANGAAVRVAAGSSAAGAGD